MNTAKAIVKQLEVEGVEYIFGIPGEENLDFLEALRESSIKLILTRHEQSAGFMAATIGRLTGKAGVCISTLGPGATNFVTAAAYAQLGGMPMLMITGQKPIKSSKQGLFQIINVVEMMKPITKFTRQIIGESTALTTVREAFRIAHEERPGAVHIELAEDIAIEPTQSSTIEPAFTRRPLAEEKAIQKALELVVAAKNPLVCIGAGANRKLVSKMLTEFINKSGIYFFSTQMGKGVIDERHPKYLGTAALSSKDYVHCAIERADLIINIGHDVIEKPPFFMEENMPQVIHINFTSATVDKVYHPQTEVVGDIANTLWRLSEKINALPNCNNDYFARVKTAVDKATTERADDNSFPLLPQRIVADIRKAMPSDGIVALDNGMYKLWFARSYSTHERNTLLLDNALATMGAGLPSAIAAKILYPEKQVIAVCGDGGFMMNSQELMTAIEQKLDLVVIIINDNAFGMIKWKQQGMDLPDFGLNLHNPDFCKYAESYGATGTKISAANQLITAIQEAQKKGGVHVIEVPVDYTQNHEVLTKELALKNCTL